MTTKTPFASKKLNKSHRVRLMNLAFEKFKEHEMRAAERQALALFWAPLCLIAALCALL